MRLALDGEWTLSGAGFTVEQLRTPVCIPHALKKAGVITSNDAGLEPLASEWIFRRWWKLETSASLMNCTHERVILSLPELTGSGEIYVNGEHAADFDGPAELEVTQSLACAQCRIEIRFAPRADCAMFGLGEGAQLRGINSLRLHALCMQAGDAALRAFAQIEAYVPGTYVFRYAFEQGGRALGSIEFEQRLPAGRTALEHLLETENVLEGAARWREGSLNEKLHVRLLILRRGEACDAALACTGLRRIDRAHPAPGLLACMCGIDGRKAALLGACYEPEPMAEDGGRAIVAQAAQAGMTALYVKGAAERAFYDACDARGMMVFQELPADAKAADAMIRRLCAHPCIVQWGCESIRGTQGRVADMTHPTLAAITETLSAWADERPFVGAAPSGVEAPGMLLLHAQGPSEATGPEGMPRFFNQDTAPYRTMRLPALLYMEDWRRAAGGMDAWTSDAPSGPLWMYRGGMWPPIDRLNLRDFVGEDVWANARTMSILTRFLQAESVRYALECARAREAFGLFAQRLGTGKTLLCDDILVEKKGRKRPAYDAFAQAMKRVHVCARLERTGWWTDTRFDAVIRIVTDAPRDETAQIEAILYRADGSVLERESFPCTLSGGEYGCFQTQLPDEPGAVLLRLTLRSGEKVMDQTDQLLCVGLTGPLWPLAHLPGTTLRVKDGFLENTGGFIAFGVCGQGILWRALLPGEKVAFEGLRDEMKCMNAVVL